MFGLHLGLQTVINTGSAPAPSNLWLWETGIEMLWETGYNIQID